MNVNVSRALPFYGNALMSSISGAWLLLAPDQVGQWLGWGHALLFQVLGAGLLCFAAALVWIAADVSQRRQAGRLASIADFAWVLLTPLVCWWLWESLTLTGVSVLLIIALLVEVFGSWQWWVTRRA